MPTTKNHIWKFADHRPDEWLNGVITTLPLMLSATFYNSRVTNTYPLICFLFTLILSLYFIIRSIFKANEFIFSKIDIIVIIALIWIGLVGIIITNNSIVEYSIRSCYLYCLAIFYVSVRLTRIDIMAIFFGLRVTLILALVYGICQYSKIFPSHNQIFPITGSFDNPGPYAGFLCCLLPFAVFKVGQVRFRNFEKLFWLAILILSIIVLYQLSSRAALLSFLVSISWLLYQSNFDRIRRMKLSLKWYHFVLFLTIIAGASAYVLAIRIDSVSGRALIWKITTNMIGDNFFTGVGFNGYETQYSHYQANYFKSSDRPISEQMLAQVNRYAFNEPLRIFAEIGIIGFCIISYLGFEVFRQAYVCLEKNVFTTIAGSLVAVIVFSLFSYPLNLFPFAVYLVIVLAVISNYSFNRFSAKVSISCVLRRCYLVILSLVVSTFLFHLSDIFRRSRKVESNLGSFSFLFGSTLCASREDVFDYFIFHRIFFASEGDRIFSQCPDLNTLNYLRALDKHISSIELKLILGKVYESQSDFSNAEKQYLMASYLMPSLFEPKLRLMLLYEKGNNLTKAKGTAKSILGYPPKIDSDKVKDIKARALETLNSL